MPSTSRDQMLEVRTDYIHVARKEKRSDEWDQPIAPYDPPGAGVEVIEVKEVETRYPQQSARKDDGDFPVGKSEPTFDQCREGKAGSVPR